MPRPTVQSQIARLASEFYNRLQAEKRLAGDATEEEPVARSKPKEEQQGSDIFRNPIFTWQFSSSKPQGGIVTKYRTQLNQNGTLSCDCAGWIIKRYGRPRWCKHCETVQPEVPQIMKDFRDGKELPLIDIDPVETGPAKAQQPNTGAGKIPGRRRFIEV